MQVFESEIQNCFSSIRKATLAAVESIMRWREGLALPHPFVWKGEDFLLRTQHDLDFFDRSQLSQMLNIRAAGNPFLLPEEYLDAPFLDRKAGSFLRRVFQAQTAIFGEAKLQEELATRVALAAEQNEFFPFLAEVPKQLEQGLDSVY